MKKILTLLVMFLAAWNIVSAQMPVFGYEAVVRDTANMPMENTQVGVTVSVLNGADVVYEETHANLTTNAIGMVSILVGMGTPTGTYNMDNVDWKTAEIRTTFTVNGDVSYQPIQEPVLPVPYALQSGNTVLTTEMITRYLVNDTTTMDDFNQVMQALRDNAQEDNQAGKLASMLQDRLVQYLKSRKDLAVEIAASWLSTADSEDVQWAYDAITGTHPAFDTAVKILVEIAKNNKAAAIDIATSYLGTLTPDDVTAATSAIQPIEDDIWAKVVNYAIANRPAAMQMVNYYLNTATQQEMTRALNMIKGNESFMNAFVYGRFYSYLDYYLGTTPGTGCLTDQQIQDAVHQTLEDRKTTNNFAEPNCDVDLCKMRQTMDNLMNNR